MPDSPATLLLLGTGTCVPDRQRSSACYAVQVEGFTLLLDIGTGALRRLVEGGVDYRTVDGVWLSHFHPDHTSDLVPLIFANLYTPDFQRRHPLTVLGPRGLFGFMESLALVWGPWVVQPEFPLELREVSPGPARFGPFALRAIPARHSRRSLSLRLETPNGHSLVYSGDTGYSEDLVELARGCDTLLIECSYPSDRPVEAHLTPRQVGEIAAAAGCRRVVLTHFYPLFENEDPAETVRQFFSGEVISGEDFLRLPLD